MRCQVVTIGERDAARPGMQNNAELAYRRLRERLVAGNYEPGQRLTELDICADLGMSRTPVREALRRLQSDGLVASTGRGVVVNSLSQEDIRHALELHGALDTLAAKLVAQAQREGRRSPSRPAVRSGIMVGDRPPPTAPPQRATRCHLG